MTLTISCEDNTFRNELESWAKGWANRNGAKISFVEADQADVRILKANEWTTLAQADKLLPVPVSFTSETGGYQWTSLVPVYQTTLSRWGLLPYAVPLTAEGYAFVIRVDLLSEATFAESFRNKYGREASTIRSWEDLAEVAEAYANQTKATALTPLPGDVQKAFVEFSQIAACYDRAPTGGGKIEEGETDLYRRGLSFYIDNELGRARFDSPSFREAVSWYHRTARFRAATGEPMDCLLQGKAVASIVPLSDLVKLPQDSQGIVDGKFSLSQLPGTRKFFNAQGEAIPVATPNFIPYLGGAGLVAVVNRTSKNPESSWSFLAELGGFTGSEMLLNEPSLGAGPLRKSHLLQDVKAWRRYRFDDARTAILTSGLQQYQAVGTLNPALALRTPDQADIAKIIVEQIRTVSTGRTSPGEAHDVILRQWAELDQKTPSETLKQWRRRAAGMN